MDTQNCLGPSVLQGIENARGQLEKAATDLEALIDSIAPVDTDLKRRVTVLLRLAAQGIESVLDNLEAARTTASGR